MVLRLPRHVHSRLRSRWWETECFPRPSTEHAEAVHAPRRISHWTRSPGQCAKTRKRDKRHRNWEKKNTFLILKWHNRPHRKFQKKKIFEKETGDPSVEQRTKPQSPQDAAEPSVTQDEWRGAGGPEQGQQVIAGGWGELGMALFL